MGVAARLTAYALALLLVFGVAWFVGGLVRPSVDPAHEAPTSGNGHDMGDMGGDHDRAGAAGLGAPDGTWRTRLRLPAPGVWRAFVDPTPIGGPTLVLGVDLVAAGPFAPFTFPPSRTAEIGGFQLRLDGDLVPGVPSQVFATVSRDGTGVTDLQPYLGAFGQLVALREGDLAYAAAAAGPGVGGRAGPGVAFTATAPSDGTYRLFLQFRVADVMRTAEFTVPTRNP